MDEKVKFDFMKILDREVRNYVHDEESLIDVPESLARMFAKSITISLAYQNFKGSDEYLKKCINYSTSGVEKMAFDLWKARANNAK